MKNVLVIALLVVSSTAFAQKSKVPLKEFTIALSAPSVELKSSDTQKVTFSLVKSKGYQKSKTYMSVSPNLPAGLTVSFEPAEGNFDTTDATLTAQGVAPGTYNIILNATVNNQKKGSILKVIVQ